VIEHHHEHGCPALAEQVALFRNERPRPHRRPKK
jgi:hypothetical protein